MTTLRTTFLPRIGRSDHRPVILPSITERELDQVWDATADGTLLAVAHEGELIACATREWADRIVNGPDQNAINALDAALLRAQDELRSLRDIIGEVMSEANPRDHRWRLDDAALDVEKQLDALDDALDEMS